VLDHTDKPVVTLETRVRQLPALLQAAHTQLRGHCGAALRGAEASVHAAQEELRRAT
jgi:hypothetical protein